MAKLMAIPSHLRFQSAERVIRMQKLYSNKMEIFSNKHIMNIRHKKSGSLSEKKPASVQEQLPQIPVSKKQEAKYF